MNNVHDIRAWQTARRFGPNVQRAVRKAIRQEQEAGGDGREALKPYAEHARRARMTPKDSA
jgi:hypothetical protein